MNGRYYLFLIGIGALYNVQAGSRAKWENSLWELSHNSHQMLHNVQIGIDNAQHLLHCIEQKAYPASQIDHMIASMNKHVSVLEQQKNTMQEIIPNLSATEEKTLKRIASFEEKLTQSMHEICAKLDIIEKSEKMMQSATKSFTISQKSIGQGGVFNITSPGYYKLIEPASFILGPAIKITSDNVILDLNGLSIEGKLSPNGPCVCVDGVQYVTIKNGSLQGAEGIVVHNVHDIVIKEVTGFNNRIAVVTLSNAHQAMIHDCIFSHTNNGSGLIVTNSSSNITIKDCSAIRCAENGFWLAGSNIALSNAIAQSNEGAGILCGELTRGQVFGNSIEGNGSDGIVIESTASDVHIMNNRILGNKGVGLHDKGAINSVCLSNISTCNSSEDYIKVKAVAAAKATSYWHNIHG